MKQLLIFTILFLLLPKSFSQEPVSQFTVGFFNVENLFDLLDNPGKIDEEFTPEGNMAWDQEKYEKKLEDISRAISAMSEKGLPELVGLCEIENAAVLEDLISRKSLKKGNYGIAHQDSPDVRGIDVALIYRKDKFSISNLEVIPINFPFDSSYTTRDILHVEGTTDTGEKLTVFVNHWSSRRNGEKESEPKRIYTAVALRKAVDRIMNEDPDARIIIIGDFNDEPTNRSIFETLLANNKRKNASDRELFNLMYDMHNQQNLGTYNYRGTWNMLDQIIVSRIFFKDPSGFRIDYDGARILKEDWMLYHDEQNRQYVPSRTYGGPNYYGGLSDHFPVYVTLTK